ncbi:MAG: S9 family peptidase, partial [Bryobacteraceae bacterium]
MKLPSAKVVPTVVTVHGDPRVDNYFWLRDRRDPDVLRYLKAENRFTEAALKHLAPLRKKLYREILARIQQTDLSVPVRRDDYYYYTRTVRGKQYPLYCRKRGSEQAPEELLLDANALARGHDYFRLGHFSISPDHKLLAYSTDTKGDEAFIIRVKNLDTGKLLADKIPNAYYSLEWANDNRTFFYTVLDAAKRPHKVFRHTLGEKPDTLVYHEKDQRFALGVSRTRSRRFLLIEIGSAVTSEARYLSSDRPHGRFRVLLPRIQDVEYDVSDHGEFFYIRTNQDAKTFRLMRTPVAAPSPETWQEVLAARPNVNLEGVDTFRDHLIVWERENGLPKIRVERLESRRVHYIDFPEPAYSAAPAGNAEYNTDELRFTYSSLVTPDSVYDYNLETRERELKKRREVLGGYEPDRYRSERVFATAPDGVKIPISLIYRKGTPRDGTAPMLLNAYGSYGISSEPAFSSERLSLLDRGFICAIAHIRGGGELGKPWHDDGKLMNKRNTFTDFIACAEFLIRRKYTAAGAATIWLHVVRDTTGSVASASVDFDTRYEFSGPVS